MRASLLKAAGYIQQSLSGGGSTLSWNPQQLGTSVVRGLWLPFSNQDTVTHSSNAISQVDDLSGNDYHMVTAGNSPNFNSGTVELDHTNDEHMLVTMDTPPSKDVGILFVYAEIGNADAFGRYVGGGDFNDQNTTGVTAWLAKDGGNNLRTVSENSQALVIDRATIPGFNLIEVKITSTDFVMKINGTQVSTSSNSGKTGSFEFLSIGRAWTNAYGGSLNIRAMCMVQGEITADQEQRIEGYLMAKVGDQASLPVSHPYKDTTFVDPSPAPSYNPATAWEYHWAFDDVKSGWNTILGGDSATTMFIDSPQLAIAEGGSFPGLETGSTAGHASNPPYGWGVNDTSDFLEMLSGGGEIALKPSMWDGTSDAGYAPGTGPLAWAFRIKYNGPAGDDLMKGSGATLPSSKIENVGGVRLKINDNFNSQADGLGTDSSQSEFYFSPAPSNGDEIFFAYARIPSDQKYYYWYAPVVPGNDRTDLQKSDSLTTNSIYLKTTPRNDTQSTKLIRLNEGAGMRSFEFTGDFTTFSEIDTLIGDHYEYLVANV